MAAIGAVEASRIAPGGSAALRRWGLVAYLVLLVPYLTGLLLWLGIGLVPTLAAHVGWLHQELARIVRSHDRWSVAAHRILDRTLPVDEGVMTMGGPGSAVAGLGTTALQYAFSALNLAFGLLLAVRLPYDRVPRLLAFAMLGTAATFNAPSHEVFHVIGDVPAIIGIHFMFHVVSGVAYLWGVVLFPDGKLPGGLPTTRWSVRLAVIAVTAGVTVICWRSSFIHHPPFFVVFFGIMIPTFGIPAQTLRIRGASTPEHRQQCRLLRWSLYPALATGIIWLVCWVASRTDLVVAHDAAVLDVRLEAVFPVVFALVPLTLLVALLRYRLWDIDVLVSRTLVYVLLGSGISLAYVAIVVATGRAARVDDWALVAVMAVVGVAIEPVRVRVRALVNRVVFGQSLNPAQAMRALAGGLDRLGPTEELQELTRVVVAGSRAVRADIWLVVDDHLLCVARWPDGPASGPSSAVLTQFTGRTQVTADACAAAIGGDRCLPIYHQDRLLGVLSLVLPQSVSLPKADEQLVADLAGAAGLLVHNAYLAAELSRRLDDLAAATVELRRSRQQVVSSQDAERRRLERNLHDGAQQELVALLVGLRTAQAMLGPRFGKGILTSSDLDELRTMLASTSETLALLAGGGLPDVLVEHGLEAALRAVTASLARGGLEVVLEVEHGPSAGLDVEAAVYFCCVESLQNVVKHAQASIVTVSVRRSSSLVELIVADDGSGFDPTVVRPHRGLGNLVDRLAVLGGTVTIASMPGEGTTVHGWVPIAADNPAGPPPSRRPPERAGILGATT